MKKRIISLLLTAGLLLSSLMGVMAAENGDVTLMEEQECLHTECIHIPKTNPTCDRYGFSECTRCLSCGECFGYALIPALGHTWEGTTCVTCGKVSDIPVSLMGDVNLDGQVSYQDALSILRSSISLEELKNEQLADVNSDSVVNYNDALIALRTSIGLENITGTVYLDGLEVYFRDVTPQIYQQSLDYLKNNVPKRIKDANYRVSIIPDKHWAECYPEELFNQIHQDYRENFLKNGGLNITLDSVSYVYVRVFNRNWEDQELRTLIHEMAHGFDWHGSPNYDKLSQTEQWIDLHEQEGAILAQKYYSKDQYEALSEYDRREETLSMASEAYVGNPEWFARKCPKMYAFLEQLWSQF